MSIENTLLEKIPSLDLADFTSGDPDKKAKFVKRPEDPYDENMQKLYEIRPNRRITREDMDLIMPNWTEEM